MPKGTLLTGVRESRIKRDPALREPNRVSRIAIDKLVAHPDNPNRMSRANFAKLVRNIERTGRYEPLIVRPFPSAEFILERSEGLRPKGPCLTLGTSPQKSDCFQIINGHHRRRALQELGYKAVDVVVWDIDDKDTDILLATLNRLGGSDVLDKKLALLKRLNQQMEVGKLAKLLPQTAKRIERLASILDTRISIPDEHPTSRIQHRALVFFINDEQREIIEKAVSDALSEVKGQNKAMKKAAALTYIAQQFITRCAFENRESKKPRNNY